MPVPLLGTKLYLPRPRPGLVPRPRVSERLDRGATSKLVLISAPAGFGKTTLLAGWSAKGSADGSVAWLSVDRSDNDPASFWAYVIAALRTVAPAIGADELELLASPQPPPIHLVLTTLLNDLGTTGNDIVLVLDDYHLIEAREIQEGMAFLLDHLPPQLHLVIAGRTDPALPIARLRARGELVEIRAADLRFTAAETAAYLNGTMGLQLTGQDVAALEERTEGWIAALQLAALSMQGRDDVAGFIAGFSGDDRYIVDYLAEEVLQRQPAEVRDFLLQTSLLSRLSGPLCDAVTEMTGGRARLEALDRGNLFVVPLDDRRDWYRYHHLFADVLRARLGDESPNAVVALHRRACDWYAANGELSEAIEHAIAGGHFERAADLAELAMPAMGRDRQEATMRGWLELLPDEVIQVRPVLSNGLAGVMLSTGVVDGVERRLRDAERWLEETPHGNSSMVVVDEEGFRRLPAGVAVHRAGLALMTGDALATVAHARRALTMLEDDDDLLRGAATALIGLASWASGDLVAARVAYSKCLDSMQRAGHISDLLGCSIALADIRITLGDLRGAQRTYETGLALAAQTSGHALRGTADMYVGLSALQLERNDPTAARQFLLRSEELGEYAGLPQNRYRWRVAMAGVLAAEGDPDGAVTLLDDAELAYVGDFSPNVRPVPATRARVWIRQGNVADALEWARDMGLSVQDDPVYLHEYEHLTLARALLARGDLDEATELLGRLLTAANAGLRTSTVIEILVLQSLVNGSRGDVPAALVSLERALTLAAPEGYVRMFVDEGPPVRSLLEAAGQAGIAKEYVEHLLAACSAGATGTPPQQGLIDPLSRRELDVLRLLGTDLGGPDIARELFVSLNTLRTHTKNIYAKLGVNDRRAAVRRSAELGL